MPHSDKIVRSVSVSFVCLLGFKGASTSRSLCAHNFWFKYDNVLLTGLAFLQAKNILFCPLPGLTGKTWQKMAKMKMTHWLTLHAS